MGNENDEDVVLRLPVRKSKISSVESGIARLHSSHMDVFEEENEGQMVVLRHDKKDLVVKIVSDRLAPKDTITLRSGDMEKLDVREGDTIEVEPYHKLTDELKERWNKFISRFKRKDEEEEGGN